MAVVCLPEDTLYYTCLENQIKDDPDTKALMDTMRNVPLVLVLQEHVATVKAAKSKKMSKSQNHTSKKAESKSDVRTKSNEQSAKDTNGTRSVTLKDKANIENQIIDGQNGKQGVKPGLQTKTCHIEVAAADHCKDTSSDAQFETSVELNPIQEEGQYKQRTAVKTSNKLKNQHLEKMRGEILPGEKHNQEDQKAVESMKMKTILEDERLLTDKIKRENQKHAKMDNADKRFRKYLYEKVRLCEIEAVSSLLEMIPVPDQLEIHDPPYPATSAAQNLELWEEFERNKDGISLISANTGIQETILHVAVKTGCIELVKLFLERGAPLVAVDSAGRNPLHIAAQTSSTPLDIIKLLVEYGPVRYVDIQTMDMQETCLHFAASNSNTELVHYLLTMHAKVHLVNSSGHTAEKVASLLFSQYDNDIKNGSEHFSAQRDSCKKVIDIFDQAHLMLQKCQAEKDKLEKEKKRQEAIKLQRERQEDEKMQRKQEEKVLNEAKKRQKEEELLISIVKSTSSNKKKKKAKGKPKAQRFSSEEQEHELGDKQVSHDYPTPSQENSTLSSMLDNKISMMVAESVDILTGSSRSIETQTKPQMQHAISESDIAQHYSILDIENNVDQRHRDIPDMLWNHDPDSYDLPPMHLLSKQFDGIPVPSNDQFSNVETESQYRHPSESSALLSTSPHKKDLLKEIWKTTNSMAHQHLVANAFQQPDFRHPHSLPRTLSDIGHEQLHPNMHFSKAISPPGRQQSSFVNAVQIQPNGGLLGWSSFPKKLKYPPCSGINPLSTSSKKYVSSLNEYQVAASASDVASYLPQFSLFG
ncbi:hypothetical protein VKS41_004371 [Umbelopsis sp. WA50703]